jgi:hypothetical protein
MLRLLPFAAVCLAALCAAPAASATLYGVESNAELANSNVTRESQRATLDKMRAQGVRIIRANVHWNEAAPEACNGQSPAQLRDPDNACYDWRVFDGIVEESKAHGIQVLVSVTQAPHWLQGSSDPRYLGTTAAQWARSVMHYSAFMAAAARRYAPGSAHGVVRYWTVWNEPNSVNYFRPMNTRTLVNAAPARYAQLFAQSAIAIKSVNSVAQVALGPTGPNSSPWKPYSYVKAVERNLPRYLPGTGAKERSYVAAWAHNPYPGVGTAPSRGVAKLPTIGMSNIRELVRLLDAYPLTRGKPIWATEFAYQTNPPDDVLGIAPPLQGRFLAESFDWLSSTGRVPIAIWYGFTDPVNIADWQGGTYYFDGRAKPSMLWYRRPISIPVSLTRRGLRVRVWARSMVNPAGTRINYSYDGRHWRLLPISGRRSDGTTIVSFRMFRKTWFATWDGTGRGPARVVNVH